MRVLGMHSGCLPVMENSPSPIPLSEAILLGSIKRPQKVDGFYEIQNSHLTKTCAIVAALDGIGIMDEVIKKKKSVQAYSVFPVLNETVKGCPACVRTTIVTQGLEIASLTNATSVIIHLNDDHKWTRPRIAEWVKTVEQTVRQREQTTTSDVKA